MYQLNRHLLANMNALKSLGVSSAARLLTRRLTAAGSLALLSLVSLQPPATAQSLSNGQTCFVIADNNPPATGGGGGTDFPDSLIRINNFTARDVTVVAAQIPRAGGGTVNGIEALTSRPDFGELIAANENEIGTIDPEDGTFNSIGVITQYQDFDAIAIDRNSENQTRLIGVSKRRGPDRENAIVEVFIEVNENNESIGLSEPVELSRIAPGQFTGDTNSIDGIAIDSNTGIVYGVANGGPLTDQRFVIIDINNGTLQDRGPFLSVNGTEINDVEDLSFDLVDNILFASTGSNVREEFTEFGFLYSNPAGGTLGNALDEFDIEDAAGAVGNNIIIDYEASACIRQPVVTDGSLLLVKRITAITPVGGSEQRFESFQNQQQDTFDDELQAVTENAFPLGVVQPAQPLTPGDLVEYTVYVYNNTDGPINNIELCDPLRRPNVLQPDSVEFAAPNGALTLNFNDLENAERSPQAPAEASCSAALGDEDGQFLAGPPGPIGPGGTGGGVVSDRFNLAPGEIAAVRFVVEVGAPQGEETVDDFDADS